MADAAEFFSRQDTALIVAVPEAEDAVGRWRASYDESASFGVPAHVTVLFPWLPRGRIDESALNALRDLLEDFEPFVAEFTRIERLPEVIWLRPSPDAAFRSLTAAVWKRWPEHPPYGGRFDDVIPHLTVADGDVTTFPEQIEDSIRPHLPIRTRVTEVQLIRFADGRWTATDRFPLGDSGGRTHPPPPRTSGR